MELPQNMHGSDWAWPSIYKNWHIMTLRSSGCPEPCYVLSCVLSSKENRRNALRSYEFNDCKVSQLDDWIYIYALYACTWHDGTRENRCYWCKWAAAGTIVEVLVGLPAENALSCLHCIRRAGKVPDSWRPSHLYHCKVPSHYQYMQYNDV